MAKNLFARQTESVEPTKTEAVHHVPAASVALAALAELGFDPAENLKDEIPEIPQIKVLPQAQMFRMPDESTLGSVQGVIVETYRCNGWWDKDNPREDNRPACSSLNDLVPLGNSPNPQSDKCATCKRNQFGSDVGLDGKPGSGKACKNMRRIYLLMQDHEFPYNLSLSPTSLKSAKKYLTGLSDRKRHYATVLTKITLRKETRGSNVYSTAEFTALQDIDEMETLKRISKIKQQVAGIVRSQAITGEEYGEAEAEHDGANTGSGDPF